MNKPELPPDITMEQFLHHVSNPIRWINNFKYGYVPSIKEYDTALLVSLIQEIRAAKLARLKGLTRGEQCDIVSDDHIIEIKTNANT